MNTRPYPITVISILSFALLSLLMSNCKKEDTNPAKKLPDSLYSEVYIYKDYQSISPVKSYDSTGKEIHNDFNIKEISFNLTGYNRIFPYSKIVINKDTTAQLYYPNDTAKRFRSAFIHTTLDTLYFHLNSSASKLRATKTTDSLIIYFYIATKIDINDSTLTESATLDGDIWLDNMEEAQAYDNYLYVSDYSSVWVAQKFKAKYYLSKK